MEIAIITMNTVEEYLNGMAQCEDWMSFKLAKVYLTITNETGYTPTVDDVTEYVNNYTIEGYLKKGAPCDADVFKSLQTYVITMVAQSQQSDLEATASWFNR